MSGKNLVITQNRQGHELSLQEPNSTQQKSGDLLKLEHLVEKLTDPDENHGNTIEDILKHPQVKKHGMLGRLSNSQQSLVTSVVSLMQDKVTSDAHKNAEALKQVIIHEREALRSMSNSFAATAKSLYKLPLLSGPRPKAVFIEPKQYNSENPVDVGVAAGDEQGPPSAPPNFVERYLNWGNLISISAVILAILVIKTSVETANFETQYRLTQESLEQLSASHEKLQQANLALQERNQTLGEANAALEVKLEEQTKQITAATDRNRQERELQTKSQVDAEQKIKEQATQLEQSKNQYAQMQLTLNKEIAALQQELAGVKGKEAQQDENYQIWKSLAEERKLEIEKLQSQVMELATEQRPKEKSGFLGLF